MGSDLSEAQRELLARACRPNCKVTPGDKTAWELWHLSYVSIALGPEWTVTTLPEGRTALGQSEGGADA